MTYRTVQKVGNNFYLYEVDAVWDPVKKNSRQKRRYLGKCDPDGNLIAEGRNSRSVETVKTFGPYYMLTEIARSSGIMKRLIRVFGERDGKLLLALATVRLVKPGPMRQILDHLDDSFLYELLDLEESLTLADIASLLGNTGISASLTDRYFRESTRGKGATVFELSPFRPMTIRDSFFYCAECRTGRIPRINVSMVVTSKDRIPAGYVLYRTYVSDMPTLNETERRLREAGISDVHHVMGPRFFNEMNIRDMIDSGLTFTMTVPHTHPLGRKLLQTGSSAFFRSKDIQVFNGYDVKVLESSFEVDGSEVRAIVLEEEARRYEDLEELHQKMNRFEEAVSGMTWGSGIYSDLARTQFMEMLPLFRLSGREDGGVYAERNHQAVEIAKDRCGKLIIITTTDLPWKRLLYLCKSRDGLEYDYSVMQEDLEGKVKYIPNAEASYGAIFLEFLEMQIKSELINRIRSSEGGETVSAHDVISVLNKMKIVYTADRWKLTLLTDEQRSALRMAGVSIPSDT